MWPRLIDRARYRNTRESYAPAQDRHLLTTWTRRRESGQLWERLAVNQDTLDYYAAPGRFTTLGDGDFPSGAIGEVVAVVQGLLVYDVVAQPFYGVELTPIQADAIHGRDTARLLDIVRAIDARPLNEHRHAADRVRARCHAFSWLTVAFLRAGGVSAHARCGVRRPLPTWLVRGSLGRRVLERHHCPVADGRCPA